MISSQDDRLNVKLEESPTNTLGYLNRGLIRVAQAALKNPNLTHEERQGLILLLGILHDLTLSEDQAKKALDD